MALKNRVSLSQINVIKCAYALAKYKMHKHLGFLLSIVLLDKSGQFFPTTSWVLWSSGMDHIRVASIWKCMLLF